MSMGDRGYEVIAGIAMFVGFGGLVAIAGWIWRLSERLSQLKADAALAKLRAEEALLLVVRTRDHLAGFEVDAARRFVTDDMLAKVEKTVLDAINRLADRLDRAFEARHRARAKSSDE